MTQSMSRQRRVHWNAATAYPNLEAHLLDVLEEWTPLPTDLCSLVVSFLGSGFRSCLPLPRGCALLEVSTKRGAVQLREGCDEASYQLTFRHGGYLHMQGPLFKRGQHGREKPSWHVLRSIVSLRSDSSVRQLKYYDHQLIQSAAAAATTSEDEEPEPPRKKRRLDQAARRIIHQQTFAYYQVLPCGVNLFRDPSDANTVGLVSGECLLYAYHRSTDPGEGSTLYSIDAAMQSPLTSVDHWVMAYFRPLGVCEWNGGRCNRHASRECANSCCSAAHCVDTSAQRQRSCDEHANGRT